MNFGTYAKEFRYILTASQNTRSRLALLTATAQFHLNNLVKSKAASQDLVEVDLDIGGKPRRVAFRRYSGDVFILYEVLAFKSYEIPVSVIDPASVTTIVDCGANIGLTALYFASKYPNARIVSIEPDPANFALLARNVAHEPRISTVQAAVVGRTREAVYLSQDRPAWGNSIADASGGASTVKVDAVTIKELCERFALSRIDILKVDIEGGEEDVFAAPAFMNDVRYVMIELHNDYTLDRFRRDIAPLGFEARAASETVGPRAVTAVRRKETENAQ